MQRPMSLATTRQADQRASDQPQQARQRAYITRDYAKFSVGGTLRPQRAVGAGKKALGATTAVGKAKFEKSYIFHSSNFYLLAYLLRCQRTLFHIFS